MRPSSRLGLLVVASATLFAVAGCDLDEFTRMPGDPPRPKPPAAPLPSPTPSPAEERTPLCAGSPGGAVANGKVAVNIATDTVAWVERLGESDVLVVNGKRTDVRAPAIEDLHLLPDGQPACVLLMEAPTGGRRYAGGVGVFGPARWLGCRSIGAWWSDGTHWACTASFVNQVPRSPALAAEYGDLWRAQQAIPDPGAGKLRYADGGGDWLAIRDGTVSQSTLGMAPVAFDFGPGADDLAYVTSFNYQYQVIVRGKPFPVGQQPPQRLDVDWATGAFCALMWNSGTSEAWVQTLAGASPTHRMDSRRWGFLGMWLDHGTPSYAFSEFTGSGTKTFYGYGDHEVVVPPAQSAYIRDYNSTPNGVVPVVATMPCAYTQGYQTRHGLVLSTDDGAHLAVLDGGRILQNGLPASLAKVDGRRRLDYLPSKGWLSYGAGGNGPARWLVAALPGLHLFGYEGCTVESLRFTEAGSIIGTLRMRPELASGDAVVVYNDGNCSQPYTAVYDLGEVPGPQGGRPTLAYIACDGTRWFKAALPPGTPVEQPVPTN